MDDSADITRMLRKLQCGDARAESELLECIYDELRKQAAHYLARERRDHTLQPTALVHEAYLRIMGKRDKEWQNRSHFLAVAAQVMRHVLVDHARRRKGPKHGGHMRRVLLEEGVALTGQPGPEVLDLEIALDRLAQIDPRLARIVEYRYYGGMEEEEIAEALEISRRTVRREWSVARAFLYGELKRIQVSRDGNSAATALLP